MSHPLRKIKNHSVKQESLTRLLRDQTKRVRFVLLFGGIALVAAGFYLGVPKEIPKVKEVAQVAEQNSFAAEPVKIDKELLKSQTTKDKKKTPPDRITVPSLGIDLPVKSSQIVNGYWEVFTDTAGWGVGSAFPEDTGNQVIFAHAREGLFLPLKNAMKGQTIYVFAKDKFYRYEISVIKEVLPSQTDVIAPTTEAVLTLYTCTGFADSKRLIVSAKRV